SAIQLGGNVQILADPPVGTLSVGAPIAKALGAAERQPAQSAPAVAPSTTVENGQAMQPLVMSAYNPAGLSGRAMSMGREATLNSADGVDTTRVAVLVPASISMHGGEVTEAIQSERTEPGAGYIKAVVSCEKDLGIPSGHSSVADFNSRKSNSGKQV